MDNIHGLNIIFTFMLAIVLFHYSQSASSCTPGYFRCFNKKCISHHKFCDKTDDCGDNSDEKFCDMGQSNDEHCPINWVFCPTKTKCVPQYFVCDGTIDCKDQSEEFNCGKNTLKAPGVFYAKEALIAWLLNRRNLKSTTDKWGPQVYRIAVALHLADENVFDPGNSLGDEIRYELTINLLKYLKDRDIGKNSQELALYIQALLVTCMNPKDFNGIDLVAELRREVEATTNYTNPFHLLVLCNSGDNSQLASDKVRAKKAYDAHLRPSWTDIQALASMALECMNGRNFEALTNLKTEIRAGSIGDFRSAALVIQALFINKMHLPNDYQSFSIDSTLQILIDGLRKKKSILHAYYALPVFSGKNLIDANAEHCSKMQDTEDEALQKALEIKGETIRIQYTVWIGDSKNVGQIWNMKVPAESTIYDALNSIKQIDNQQNVTFSESKFKPYVTAVKGIEDDPEVGRYWFVYLRDTKSDELPKIVKESPKDVKLLPNQEIILWYKSESWND